MGAFESDLGDSSFDFMRVVWPAIRDACGGGEVIPGEGSADRSLAYDMDTLAGIDAWQKTPEGMRGIASRVQWRFNRFGEDTWRYNGGLPYNTFSIRLTRESGYRTEWEKLQRYILERDDGWTGPGVTVQAYVEKSRTGPLVSVGFMRTFDLVNYIMFGVKDRHWYEREVKNNGSATFMVIPWRSIDLHFEEICEYVPRIWTYDTTATEPLALFV